MPRALGSGLVILLVLGSGCVADRASRVAPPGRDEIQAHLEAVLETAIQSHGFPAAAAAVLTSRDVHVAAMGRRRVDRADRVAVGDRFGLGSNTKAVTATMLGALVERGVLRWDTSLAAALPDLPMRPEYRAVTLRQLLTHRAGLPPWTSHDAFARALTFNTTDLAAGRLAFAAAVLAEPPVAVPGTETRYSNAGYSLAALVAERATHESWRQLVTEHVCEPLRISCAFGPPAATDPNQPWGHSGASGTGALTPVDPTVPGVSAMQGAGGLSLSIVDYAAFLEMHLRGLRGEDTAVLKAATVRELHTPEGRYALGWGIQDYAGARSSVHAGGNGQFYALVAIQPDRDRAVAFLTNDGGDDVEAQASAILKELLAGPGEGRHPAAQALGPRASRPPAGRSSGRSGAGDRGGEVRRRGRSLSPPASGEPAPEPGGPSLEPGEPAPEPGEPAPDSGEPAPEPGEPAPEPREPSLEPGEPAPEPGERHVPLGVVPP